MLQYFRDLIRALFRNIVLTSGSEGIQEGMALLARDLMNVAAEDTAKAQATLARLGVPPLPPVPSVPTQPPPHQAAHVPATPAVQQQAAVPAIMPAPPIVLGAPATNGQQEPRRGPGRPRKIPQPPQQGGTPS